tara:strand:+ start:21 stop:257 length:237 start_codon:yes stop_codon:yes gene_type:complete
MKAPDNKMRLTDVADLATIFRLVQSIPSPKAEPIKLWLAKVGHERIQEIADPEQLARVANMPFIHKHYASLVILYKIV